jgi:hypothetical protein
MMRARQEQTLDGGSDPELALKLRLAQALENAYQVVESPLGDNVVASNRINANEFVLDLLAGGREAEERCAVRGHHGTELGGAITVLHEERFLHPNVIVGPQSEQSLKRLGDGGTPAHGVEHGAGDQSILGIKRHKRGDIVSIQGILVVTQQPPHRMMRVAKLAAARCRIRTASP